jgi:cytosine deaminase
MPADNAPAADLVIRNAALLDGEGTVDIAIVEGVIRTIAPKIEGEATRTIDAAGGLVTTSFIDPHFHLDKVLSRAHFGAVSYQEGFGRARDVKRHFTVPDVESRVSRALDLAVAQGIGRIRTNVDVDFATRLVSMEGVLRARERFKGLIDVEVIAFPQEGIVTDHEAPDLLRQALDMGADLVGGLPEFERTVEDQRTHIRTVFDIAEEKGVPLDFHCDYTDLPEFKTLEMVADVTVERGMQGKVTAGHCCALAVYPDDEAKRVIDKVRAAEMNVTVLPIANLEMLGGPGRTPQNRGASRVKELLDAGVNVSAGSDNMFDIWYRFNRMDPIDTAYITCLSAGMRTDDEVREAFEMTTSRPARMMGLADRKVAEGCPADLVVHTARNLVDMFRNLPGRRIHLKDGRAVGGVEGSLWTAR